MNIEKFFMTPQEFADIIIETMHEGNYFKKDQKAHPVDLEVAFSAAAFAIAMGIDAIARKNIKSNPYNFNLDSHNISNYSEWKKQNNDKDVNKDAFD